MKFYHKVVALLLVGTLVISYTLFSLSLKSADIIRSHLEASLPLRNYHDEIRGLSRKEGHIKNQRQKPPTNVQQNQPKIEENQLPKIRAMVAPLPKIQRPVLGERYQAPLPNIQRPAPAGMSQEIKEVVLTKCTGASRQVSEGACSCVKFADHNLPLTILESYPGAGNTWVRYLLEQASGIFTGSVHNDAVVRSEGFLGESRVDPRVIVIKSHYPYHHTAKRLGRGKIEKVVLLMRRLEDAILSEWNRQGGLHTGFVTKEVDPKGFEKFVHKYLTESCEKGVLEWITEAKVPIFVLRYEAVKKDLRNALSSVLDFLGFPVSSEQMKCVEENAEGKFHRQHNGTEVSPFNDKLRKVVKEMEEKIEGALRRRKAELSQHTSGYVEI